MSSPITASYRWSKDEFLRAQRLALRHLPQWRLIYRITTIIGVLILLSGVQSLCQHPDGWPVFLITAMFSGFFFAMPLFARRTALKLYAQKPDRDMEVTWEIHDDGVRSRTPLASSENAWAFFQRAVRVREGFLLFPSGNQFHWLPMHAFHDANDAERFAELVRSKIKHYAHG